MHWAFGWLNPLLAAFIHVASEMTFILNSTRSLPRRAGTQSPQDARTTELPQTQSSR